MKRIMNFSVLALFAFMILMPGQILAADMGMSFDHDLDALWQLAQSNFDLDNEDAVILLESRQVSLSNDGNLQTRVHRVVWIGSSVGINSYSDLRIPWNSATSSLEVEKLRTWREDRWWPDAKKISDTAVVHTLPYAVDRADDYTIMRETMLLHDGVHPGCIMETAYVITEQNVPATEQIFIMPQRDPSVLTEIQLTTPPDLLIKHEALNGQKPAEVLQRTNGSTLLWQSHLTPALKQPVTSSAETYEPTVAFSTWPSWDALSRQWMQAFASAAKLQPEQAEKFKTRLNDSMGHKQRLLAVGEYLNEMVRGINYSKNFWRFAPRSASQTLATAYGHDLDRAVLAAALLAEAGIKAEPMLVGQGTALVARNLPRLLDLQRVVLRIDGLGQYLFDPADGHLKGFDEVFGHPFWYIGKQGESGPQLHLPHPDKSITIGLSLSKTDTDTWTGEGSFAGTSRFSHYGSLTAAGNLQDGYLANLAESVMPGAELKNATPDIWQDDLVRISFSVEVPALAEDDFQRLPIEVGRPVGGLLDQLPGDVHLYEAVRQSPVLGIEGWRQNITVRLEVNEDQLLHRPVSRSVENAVGSFELDVQYLDGWLTLTRSITLGGDPITANMWPDLRALLLEENDPANGLILLKTEQP